jgi:uncharacterized membrane protein YjjP (DUF1212 family)
VISPLPGPSLTFSFVLATLIGAAFHLIVGGDFRRLALYLLTGWAGFAVGHTVGVLLNLDTFNIGTIRAFPAVMGTLVALVVAFSLSSKRTRSRNRR